MPWLLSIQPQILKTAAGHMGKLSRALAIKNMDIPQRVTDRKVAFDYSSLENPQVPISCFPNILLHFLCSASFYLEPNNHFYVKPLT